MPDNLSSLNLVFQSNAKARVKLFDANEMFVANCSRGKNCNSIYPTFIPYSGMKFEMGIEI